ncbi:glutamate/aspartate:proton symporter GltP [Burkholderia cenocepacia]|uniref:glutamate/aspartate:proton symporter GltP n=1 Tax=Burkholderia cepacia complex TaxID=87882 RepID=UPI000F58CC10|nr:MULTISPECIES: glutamate/aspartate:proton symporter GltP [Burkholderia cepacia complex]ELW9450156.1 glutamate/aspartate:proton symporter GltP [Burkholderia cenocepacia]MBR8197670.1 glutamate/aspartate:proton symporter GltP [Burkholderia cenocepacia]MBR8295578.1 glutamate/aspartate:proton symporter GltP [Burkholderia cenocepacia]MBR8486177.1 glutamate/aspartate:proton symporter GltP [Burkholderia cenocepacia]MDN7471882.1 glutamate/aspartate:proton symporter GltP [Burkholderia orbicola]
MDTVIDSPPVVGAARKPRVGLAWQILIGLVIGIATGLVLNRFPQLRDTAVSGLLQPAGDIFIKLVRMIVVPIVFTSMVIGIAGVGDGKSLGRLGIKTLLYFEVVTTIAIVLGLVIGNVLQPGVGTDMSQLGHTDISRYQQTTQQVQQAHHGLMALVLGIIPDNIVASMAKGDLLPVIFFSLLFGLGLQSVPEEHRKPVLAMLKGVADAMFKVTNMVMRYAPVGVCALIAVTVSSFGFGSLLPLLKLVAVTYFAILLFAIAVLGVTARLFGFRILTLLRVIKDELIIAFSTCSSATVLPQLMKKMEDYGVPKSITTFVVPTGYTFNLDGASIYLGIGTLFVAQLYGVHLGWQQQVLLTLTMVVTSKGAAGVPGFMFVIMLATLASAGLPLEGLAFIAGVDRIMDMGRTALNVVGNALAPLVIAKWEGRYDAEKGRAYVESLRG